MNCLYCNAPSTCLNGLDWSCKKCPGEPIFADWNEEDPFIATAMTAVTFVIRDHHDYLDFYPNTQQIFIDSLCRYFQVNFVVTPDNIYETYERFINLSAFS